MHFGHENAIRFDNRPFVSVEEMDEELIRRWNAKVGRGDLVYVLGDMIWKTRNDDAPTLIKRLNGQIILIKGNHDRFLHNNKAKSVLAGVKDYDDITVTLEDGTKRRCILSHYFMPFYVGHNYGTILLHGHSHKTEESNIEREIAADLNKRGFKHESYNVGCMYWDYAPVTLDEILASHAIPTEDADSIITVELDSELYEQVGELIKPYGITHEELIRQFIMWCVDPATQEEAITWMRNAIEEAENQ